MDLLAEFSRHLPESNNPEARVIITLGLATRIWNALQPRADGQPGRIPELESTRLNAEYWETGARDEPNREEALMALHQSVNAWKNAAYAMADNWIALRDAPGAGWVSVPKEEIERLRDIEHFAWHVLEGSEWRVSDNELVLSHDPVTDADLNRLIELLGEEHPVTNAMLSAAPKEEG